jgi:hypothetical protein
VRAYLGGTYAGLHLFLYGLLLMGVILFLPNGLNDPLVRTLKKMEARIGKPGAEQKRVDLDIRKEGKPSRGGTG